MAQLTRAELYKLVWSEPMTKVADRFGVSGSYMARICNLLNVPRPERGHWAKLAVGKAAASQPLPDALPGDPVCWSNEGKPAPVRKTPSVPSRRAEAKIKIPRSSVHGLIREANAHFQNGRPLDEGAHLKPYKKLLVDITTSEASLDKALSLANDLFNALGSVGHRVVIASSDSQLRRAQIDEREDRSTPREPREEALVEDLMADWVIYHVSTLADPVRYKNSVTHWTTFFDLERAAGRLRSGATVADLTPQLQTRFRQWRAETGVGGHTISRDLAALRGALYWAWKNQRIDHPPFIADVAAHEKAPARERVLSFEEIAAIMNACVGRPEREHLIRFMVIELGTAGRPEAVLEMTDKNVDLERRLIDPNHDGRVHTRKRRAIVPIARHVMPWVMGVKGKLIKYRVPIAKRNRRPNGPIYHERETKSIKTVWNSVCEEVGVTGATPKTLRHTMLSWLAHRGVPKEQREALAGHARKGTTARNYEHLTPDYLRGAIGEIDAFFDQLAKHTSAHLRYANDTEIEATEAA